VWECFRLIRIIGVNRAGRELLVMPTMADVPRDLAQTVTEDSRERIAALLVAVAEGRHQLKGEQAFFTMKGDRREMIFELTALPGHEQSFDSVLLTLVDVTEEREMQTERDRLLAIAQDARAQAEAASRAKDQFSGDARARAAQPVRRRSQRGHHARMDSSRRARALEIAERQCDQLGRLIDDLLDVARITQARIVLRKERSRSARRCIVPSRRPRTSSRTAGIASRSRCRPPTSTRKPTVPVSSKSSSTCSPTRRSIPSRAAASS
jgi:signal transduction histidine kinase